ncbi:DNA invertase gene rlgA (plasmid) [Sinorhizobium sp. CCBAU 05631]|nr:DNA invertase gene rlgA [Sinorhizobium sp. CCBAU 05631]
MARIGYARTFTTDQNLAAQIAALRNAGCEVIREEQKSGASLEGRPQLMTILDFIHAGETFVITRIDRLARRDLQVIVDRLKAKGAHLVATEQPVDTSTAAGKAFFDMLGVFAEFETNLRRERQAEGIAAARKRGIYKGRPRRSIAQKSCFGCNRAKAPARSLAISAYRAARSIRCAKVFSNEQGQPHHPLDIRHLRANPGPHA